MKRWYASSHFSLDFAGSKLSEAAFAAATSLGGVQGKFQMRRLSQVTPQSQEFNLFSVKLSVFLCTYIVFHISMIAVGASFVDDCPAESKIPLYLIIQGVIGVITRASKAFQYIFTNEKYAFTAFICTLFLRCTEFIIFLLGSIWVYKEFAPNYNNQEEPNYCHQGMYIFALCYITITYILIFITLILLCCTVCVSLIYGVRVTETTMWKFVWNG